MEARKPSGSGRVLRGAAAVEGAVDAAWDRLRGRLGLERPRAIQAYQGWANERRAWCCCRVLATEPFGGPREDDGWWDNLLNTYRRWNSQEVPGVPMEATLAGKTVSLRADDEGYAGFTFELDAPLPEGFWHHAELRVRGGEEPASGGLTGRAMILNPPSDASFGVISDVDDTIIHSSVTNLLVAARLTFLNNAKTRKPFEGVAELYRVLQSGTADRGAPPRNPIFYVSSSAWNLYDLLSDFIELNEIPAGPLLLRDLGLDRQRFIKSAGHGHKLDKARDIMGWYPRLPFVLVGDSGQQDAELYATAAQEMPGRIKAIFIRDVDPQTATDRDEGVRGHIAAARNAGVPMFLVRDSYEAAEHAADLGLIGRDAVRPVQRERDADHERASETLVEQTASAATAEE